MKKIIIINICVLIFVFIFKIIFIKDTNVSQIPKPMVIDNKVEVYTIDKPLNNENIVPITVTKEAGIKKNLTSLISYIKNNYVNSGLSKEYKEIVYQKTNVASNFTCPFDSELASIYGNNDDSVGYGYIVIYNNDGSLQINYDCHNKIATNVNYYEKIEYDNEIYQLIFEYGLADNDYCLIQYSLLDENGNYIINQYAGNQLYVETTKNYIKYINRDSDVSYYKYYLNNGISIDETNGTIIISKKIKDTLDRQILDISIQLDQSFNTEKLEAYVNYISECYTRYTNDEKLNDILIKLKNENKDIENIYINKKEYIKNSNIPQSESIGTADLGITKRSMYQYYQKSHYYYIIYKPQLIAVSG